AGRGGERSGDDLALREQALHLGVDQTGAELVEIEDARDEDCEAEQVEDDDAPGEAGKAVAERQELAQPARPPADAHIKRLEAAAQAFPYPRCLGFLPGPVGLGGHRSCPAILLI